MELRKQHDFMGRANFRTTWALTHSQMQLELSAMSAFKGKPDLAEIGRHVAFWTLGRHRIAIRSLNALGLSSMTAV